MDTCLHGDNLGIISRGRSGDTDLTLCACPCTEMYQVCHCSRLCVCALVYQFLVADFILGALPVLRLHQHLGKSVHLHSSHWWWWWWGGEKAPCIIDGGHFVLPTDVVY